MGSLGKTPGDERSPGCSGVGGGDEAGCLGGARPGRMLFGAFGGVAGEGPGPGAGIRGLLKRVRVGPEKVSPVGELQSQREE